MLLPALLNLALAAPPTWQWNTGASRAYALEACIDLPEPLRLSGHENLEARPDRFQVQVVTSCEPALAEPRGWTLVCSLRDLSLSAEPPSPQEQLGAVLLELDARLTGALVEIAVSREGRMERFVLHEVERRDRKASRTAESLTWLLERAFLGLELSLPAGDETRWGERAPGLLTYVPRAKSLGAARLLHELQPREDGLLEIRSAGRGVVQADALTLRTELGPPGALSLSMAAESEAVFDPAAGALVSRRWAVRSRTTPSAVFDPTLMRHPYAAAGSVRLLSSGEAVTLSESRPWGQPGFTLGSACQDLEASRARLEAALEQPIRTPE